MIRITCQRRSLCYNVYNMLKKKSYIEELNMRAAAKVNLVLDIAGRRADGYHDMVMINHSVDLADNLYLRRAEAFYLSCSNVNITSCEDNLSARAYRLLEADYPPPFPVAIHIEKRIPSEAGLAGGSADAAATLLGLNAMWDLGLDREQLMNLGLKLGADVPYCIHKGTALVKGIGEFITPLPDLYPFWVVLIKPTIAVTTPWAFAQVDAMEKPYHPDVAAVMACLEQGAWEHLGEVIGNSFEPAMFSHFPALAAIKEELLAGGAAAAVMSGSGSTMVGYFFTEADALNCAEKMAGDNRSIYVTRIIE